MKANSLVADEMFPDGGGRYLGFEMVTDNIEEISGGSGTIMVDINSDIKTVHADFYNSFDDLFDDNDLK